jgi:hypothetical protein
MILIVLAIVALTSIVVRRAHAETVTMTTQLLASNEVPLVTNEDRNAFGSATVTLDTVANTARFDFSLNNLASSQIILAHIHEGPAGVIGPIRVDSLISPASPLTVVNGAVVFSRSGLTVPADVMQRLLANPAGFYFNVHSNLNPIGVARGQLARQAAIAGGGAPTLSEWGAILMTLLFIAAGVFFLTGRSRVTTLASAVAPTPGIGLQKPVDWKLLLKVSLVLEGLIALSLIALRAGPVDSAGAMTSGVIVAFIVHMLILSARRR